MHGITLQLFPARGEVGEQVPRFVRHRVEGGRRLTWHPAAGKVPEALVVERPALVRLWRGCLPQQGLPHAEGRLYPGQVACGAAGLPREQGRESCGVQGLCGLCQQADDEGQVRPHCTDPHPRDQGVEVRLQARRQLPFIVDPQSPRPQVLQQQVHVQRQAPRLLHYPLDEGVADARLEVLVATQQSVATVAQAGLQHRSQVGGAHARQATLE